MDNMRYIPNTSDERDLMLNELGMNSTDQLFDDIPEELKLKNQLNIPGPLSEIELMSHMRIMASKNADVSGYSCFLGAGAYDHYIPSAIRHLISRGEFYTAYTPYQPEISQGTLTAMFEFQTMICELTGMEVSNASMYDGAHSVVEAMLLSARTKRKNRVLVSSALNPEYKRVIDTYSGFSDITVEYVDYLSGKGSTDMDLLKDMSSEQTCAYIVQYPNFFGIIEDLNTIREITGNEKMHLIVVCDPLSLGVLKPPGYFAADIVVGEGQGLGNSLNFGGPYLGFFAVSKELMRRIPGRVAGQTVDKNGNRGFVLTLQAREQHIRRAKATSNICSNQALNALTSTIYMSIMGKEGLKEVGSLCINKSRYAYNRLISTGMFEPLFTGPFFKEFVVKAVSDLRKINEHLFNNKILGGLILDDYFPGMKNCWLVAVTENRTKEEIDNLVNLAGGV